MLTEDEFTIKKGSKEKRFYNAWWFKSKPWMMDIDNMDISWDLPYNKLT